MRCHTFILTTGDTIEVPRVLDGEAFEWLGQCSLEELDMAEWTDDGDTIMCNTPRADEIARDVKRLYDAQCDDLPGAWEAFCEMDGSLERLIAKHASYRPLDDIRREVEGLLESGDGSLEEWVGYNRADKNAMLVEIQRGEITAEALVERLSRDAAGAADAEGGRNE